MISKHTATIRLESFSIHCIAMSVDRNWTLRKRKRLVWSKSRFSDSKLEEIAVLFKCFTGQEERFHFSHSKTKRPFAFRI